MLSTIFSPPPFYINVPVGRTSSDHATCDTCSKRPQDYRKKWHKRDTVVYQLLLQCFILPVLVAVVDGVDWDGAELFAVADQHLRHKDVLLAAAEAEHLHHRVNLRFEHLRQLQQTTGTPVTAKALVPTGRCGEQHRLLWWQQRWGAVEDRHCSDLLNLLEKRIWKSRIKLDTKRRLYKTHIVPVMMYGSETGAKSSLKLLRYTTHQLPVLM